MDNFIIPHANPGFRKIAIMQYTESRSKEFIKNKRRWLRCGTFASEV
jgi:hypothetical protein